MPLTDQHMADQHAEEARAEDDVQEPKRRLFGLRRKAKAEEAEPMPLPEDMRLVDHESGEPMERDCSHLEADDLFAGNVLTFEEESGKRHYLIHEVQGTLPDSKRGMAKEEEFETPTEPLVVRLAPAKSNMHKSFLLLAILAGTWFLVSWAIKLLF